jgi:hypothetical protein
MASLSKPLSDHNMAHYSSQNWIDYVRNLVSPQDAAAMTNHLKSGCESCTKEKASWSKLAAFAKTEAQFEPPEHVVNMAKALVQAPKREKALRIREIAELVFDSFLSPQLAGVRSAAGVGSRQLLYRAGEVMIDVRFEANDESERFAVTGQVFRDQGSKVGMTRVPISLISGKNELARTSTNQFGEFYLEHESADKNLQVSLEVNSEKDVFIPLDESIWRIARQVR